LERANKLSKKPEEEILVFIHPGSSKYTETCDIYAQSLRKQLKVLSNFKDIRYGFLHQNMRRVVEDAVAEGSVIVIPLLIGPSKYYSQEYIPTQIKGLDYAYDGKALLPDTKVARWIELTALNQIKEILPILIYDEDNLLEISIEDVAKYHGDICPCVVVAFRATQLAISRLWGDKIPKRGDFKIIYAHPSDGHKDTFEYITRAKDDDLLVRPPKGIGDITKDNYTYTFTRKSTGDSITLKVKEEIFEEGFFELRKKHKTKTATKEEEKTFQLDKEELKEKFMYLPAEEIFEAIIKIGDYNGFNPDA